MYRLRNLAMLPAVAVAAVVAWSCDRGATPVSPQPDRPLFHEGQCIGNKKFTGGGRIDPTSNTLTGKMTFGFNIHVSQDCSEILKGQFQVNHHPSQTKYHSVSFQSFDSFTTPEGECFDVNLTMRTKHGNGEWHDHTVFIQGCDNGEPGSSPGTGPDTWWFATTDGSTGDGHGNTGKTELTGGNIQAH